MSDLFTKIKAFFIALSELPILEPIVAVLYSRAFVSAGLGLLVYGILPTSPWLSEDPTRLKTIGDLVIVVTLLFSGRYSLEGVVEAARQIPMGSLDELIRLLITTFLSELANPDTPEAKALVVRLAAVPRADLMSQMGGGSVSVQETYIPGRPGVAG